MNDHRISDGNLAEARRQLNYATKKSQQAHRMISDADELLKQSGQHHANTARLLGYEPSRCNGCGCAPGRCICYPNPPPS